MDAVLDASTDANALTAVEKTSVREVLVVVFITLQLCLARLPAGTLLYSAIDPNDSLRPYISYFIWRVNPFSCLAEALYICWLTASQWLWARRQQKKRDYQAEDFDFCHFAAALVVLRGDIAWAHSLAALEITVEEPDGFYEGLLQCQTLKRKLFWPDHTVFALAIMAFVAVTGQKGLLSFKLVAACFFLNMMAVHILQVVRHSCKDLRPRILHEIIFSLRSNKFADRRQLAANVAGALWLAPHLLSIAVALKHWKILELSELSTNSTNTDQWWQVCIVYAVVGLWVVCSAPFAGLLLLYAVASLGIQTNDIVHRCIATSTEWILVPSSGPQADKTLNRFVTGNLFWTCTEDYFWKAIGRLWLHIGFAISESSQNMLNWVNIVFFQMRIFAWLVLETRSLVFRNRFLGQDQAPGSLLWPLSMTSWIVCACLAGFIFAYPDFPSRGKKS